MFDWLVTLCGIVFGGHVVAMAFQFSGTLPEGSPRRALLRGSAAFFAFCLALAVIGVAWFGPTRVATHPIGAFVGWTILLIGGPIAHHWLTVAQQRLANRAR